MRPRSPSRRRSSCRRPSASTASAWAFPESSPERGSKRACSTRFRGRSSGRRSWEPSCGTSTCRTPRTRCRPTTCSRPPSAPPTWPATTGSATACAPRAPRISWTCTCARATTASGRRSSAASCSAPMPCPRATTTPTTGAHSGCVRRSPRTSGRPSRRSTSSSRPPPRPSPSGSARRRRTLSRCISTTTARSPCRSRGSPRSRSPAATARDCRWVCRSPGRPSARTACSTPPARWSGASPSTRRPPVSESRPGEDVDGMFEPVIGLEIHVQLATATKMFCGCALSFGEPPNTRTCPVCLGLPGSLPVANARAVHFGLMIGLALGSELAPRSIFHRKNYFYPDLPKGYQITQYDEPLCRGGNLGAVRIHRVHLEEDAAKLIHVGASGRIHGSATSIVDFNRGGTPLAEIVTEPDLHSPAQAREWLEVLRATLRALGGRDVDVEEGSPRADANVSLRPAGNELLGTKTELKNMNSFRYLERGVAAEIERQRAILDAGEEVVQETLHFDPASGAISSLRSKEEAHDYRYFPEPDLVPIATTEAMLDEARAAMPELPAARAERFERDLGMSAERARQLAFRA